MIDLSFLTEEEQEAIMKVLQRDAALKRAEEERVRHLPEKIKDDQQLKNMSGQWFYEAKAKRHRDKIHGADIIRASMRKKRPQIAAEQSKDRENGAKESWVNNVNKDAFLPPELAGVVEEPEEDAAPASPSSSVVNPASSVIDMSQENTRKPNVSPEKRKNPFNSSKLPEGHSSQQTKNEQSKNGRTGLFQTSKEDELSESKEKSTVADTSIQKLEKSKQTLPGLSNGSQIKAPIPKARKMIYKSTDLNKDDNQSFPRQRTDSLKARGAPRGILKRNSSSSSTDSETLRYNHNFEPKSKIVSPGLTIHERISEKEHSLEDNSSPNSLEPLKHVRFSAVKDELPQSPGLIHGREVGEFSVLESDRLKNGMEDAGDTEEFQSDPKPSQYRKPSLFHQSTSSPYVSKSETHQPMTSGSFPINGLHSHSEVLTARPQSMENSPTINEPKDKSSELTRLESVLPRSPADELSHCVEPEPSQVPGGSSRDRQQGSEEEPSPVLKTLERSAARKMPSKSLEDISSDSSNQAKVDNQPEELVRSAEDDEKPDQKPVTNECVPRISTVPTQPDNPFSHPDKLKRMSKSVPAFLQDEVSGSVMSVYSGDFGNLEVKGNIQFAIEYVESLKELHVFVAQCKDLAAADVKKQRSDPYVKAYLLPDKGKMGKKKTLVVKKTLNPVYNEILRYKIEKQILKTQKLNLSIWHRDTFKRNSFLGEVELDLETWDWDNKQNKQLRWYPLKRKTAPVALEAENRGEMKLALQYVPEPVPGKKLPTTGEVHIWVKECLDLPLLRGSHLNSFVKCTILPDTSRKSRQKTRAVGKTTNPIFNHTMVYDGFRPEDLMEACVELTVWDHYKLTNQFLGGLRIGFGTGKSYGTEVDWMDSTSEEVALWEKMVNSPNTWIEATLPLRMLLIAKISK
ncbi:synaptotagmin like 2 [Homo sapiens]|uniref:Isoform 4 of Synaptotagmin-like protein 2 n=2 Tax=Homo sapiens TaxID=9606 RepID=Q9HCH5-6|nr:synaptotagmin-like protein 2 isoform a [Homo sapiens]EAW75111.1 synaptotagmin-like 2, isoform CRA_e [Homo sapiens]KAI2562172.1 synaptotagmin like 2 [Homo sapiens]KAI2562173.1 synaptotagmin like 2 [Homo sapiens]KAI4073494.1 synaptotagmin like 2 [Homo sapiens]KAI4073506.1 synaptotagmin like 2 [Homo sapiens]|eukprot:NP_116561.1 synaptotagmin-like protein 2 isoform a [Homo sapiens]